jgi:hypothetical protein
MCRPPTLPTAAALLAALLASPGCSLVLEPVEHGAALATAWGGPYRPVTLAGARHYRIERRDDFWRAVGEVLQELVPGRPRRADDRPFRPVMRA